jgi:hypothetical protein
MGMVDIARLVATILVGSAVASFLISLYLNTMFSEGLSLENVQVGAVITFPVILLLHGFAVPFYDRDFSDWRADRRFISSNVGLGLFAGFMLEFLILPSGPFTARHIIGALSLIPAGAAVGAASGWVMQRMLR